MDITFEVMIVVSSSYVVKLCLTFATPWTVACQAPLSMGFSRQESWSGLPFSSPGDLSNPGIEPMSPALAGRFFITEPPGNITQQKSKGVKSPGIT